MITGVIPEPMPDVSALKILCGIINYNGDFFVAVFTFTIGTYLFRVAWVFV